MRGREFFWLLIFLLLPLLPIWATGPGTHAAPFLTIGFGSRAQGLGNSFVAIADDASSIYFNPAGLVGIGNTLKLKHELEVSRSSWLQDISINQLAFAQSKAGATSWGLAITNLGVENLEQRTAETDKPEGTFRAEDLSISFALARRLGHSPLSLGLTTKIIQQRIANYQGQAYALDLGSQMKFRMFRQPFAVGFSLRNLGSKLRLGNEAYPLPLSYHLGLAYQGLINQVFEVSFNENGLQNASFGSEYWFLGVFGIRGGYLANARNTSTSNIVGGIPFRPGFTGGFGFRVANALGIDYAFVPFGDLGFAQRLTLGYRF